MTIDLPEWVNWIAQDRDGRWYCYENKPKCLPDANCWRPQFGRWGLFERTSWESPDWQTTLIAYE